MARWIKILFALSLTLLILSYPACHFGEIKAESEMAKYPVEFVAAHQFDFIFARWVLPGIWLFFSSGLTFGVALIAWLIQRGRRNLKSPK